MSALWITVAALALLVHIVAHEAAHALALRRSIGGDIISAGIGLPFPPMLEVAPRGTRRWTFTLSPWLIGAYVMPNSASEGLVKKASYTNQAWFAGAGVVANLIIALGLGVLSNSLRHDWLSAAACIGLAVGAWFGRKAITFIMPAIGIALLGWLIYALASTTGQAQGPVGIFMLIEQTTTGYQALQLAIGIGYGLAAVNAIPIFPFDGGRIADAALRHVFNKSVATKFQIITGILAACLILYTIGSDIWYLIAGGS